MNDAVQPIEAELLALRAFVSKDETRPHLTVMWRYESDEGVTHVATDGHTLCCRRAGSHRTMNLHDIAKLTPGTCDGAVTTAARPPVWEHYLAGCTAQTQGAKPPEVRGIDPNYVARVGLVEKAALKRARHDLENAGGSKLRGKNLARALSNLSASCCSTLRLAGELDPWYFKIAAVAALWEILVMPRRP